MGRVGKIPEAENGTGALHRGWGGAGKELGRKTELSRTELESITRKKRDRNR